MAVRSYGPDTDLWYMCTVTLTLEIWCRVKVMIHPWDTDRITWNIIKIQHRSKKLRLTHGFWVGALWRWPWIYDLVMTQPWIMDNKLCEILSRSYKAVRSYGPDMDFGYMHTVTWTLEKWPLVKVMTHPWILDNNCVKYYPDSSEVMRSYSSWLCVHCDLDLGSRSLEVRSYGPDTIQTDGQTDRVIPIYPPNFVCRGYNYSCPIGPPKQCSNRTFGPDINSSILCVTRNTFYLKCWFFCVFFLVFQ